MVPVQLELDRRGRGVRIIRAGFGHLEEALDLPGVPFRGVPAGDRRRGRRVRFMDISLSRDNYMTTGRVYLSVIEKSAHLDIKGNVCRLYHIFLTRL